MVEGQLAITRLAGSPTCAEVLVVGPSLGTSVEALWGAAASLLSERFEVFGWDLPGHGRSRPATAPFSVAELAAEVRRIGATVASGGSRPVSYAGVSLAGAVGLELAIDPGPFAAVGCFASAAKISEPDAWRDRAALVRRAGTPVMVAGSAQRWFAAGFVDRDPATANRLLLSLSDADAESYSLACEALADFDLRARLDQVAVPLVVAPGEHDPVVTVELATATAAAAPGARLHVMAGCAHLPPAEDPSGTAYLLLHHLEEGSRA
ncbi:alpha/beta fold hydrolase [Nostocoides sp. HKS02]|uniref:alpha/beta fold hydrolase n=1 Tax=Nostocoides sp. HKS02 TaxID=1813880 RepID=UPI0012B44A0D|nr:alpha/beta hydrolase [Tetrasphaera sp. HKS02]QGN57440.1 alpha/beta fold hydrolase [Tetrasphaera sp. HKS02]